MIIVITDYDKDLKTLVASHAIDNDTGRPIVIPQVHPEQLGAKYHETYGLWYLPEKIDSKHIPEKKFIS